MSVFVKLLVSMLTCTVVPIVFVLWLVAWVHQEQTRRQVLEHLRSVAALQTNRVNGVRRHSLESLALLTSRTQLRLSLHQFSESGDAAARDKMNLILRDAKVAVPKFHRIDVLSTEGHVVASTDDSLIGTAPHEPKFVRNVLEGEPVTSIVRVSADQPFLRSAGPLLLDGMTVGVIVADSEFISLADAIHDFSGLGETGETLLAVRTEDGPDYVFPPRFGDRADDGAQSELLQAAMSSGRGTHLDVLDYRGQQVIAVSQAIDDSGWALIVKMDREEAFRTLAETRRKIVAIGVGAVVLLTGAAYAISRSLGAPLSRLATVSHQIQQGDSVCRSTDDGRRDEIGQLARAFNAMAETLTAANRDLEKQVQARTAELESAVHELDRSNGELEQFASIASHDLQTPIRNVATAVDLLQRQLEPVDLNDDAQRYMRHLQDASALMRSQIEGLLKISRVHSRGGDTSADVDTNKLVAGLIDDLKIAIDETGADIRVDPLPPVHGDKTQLRQVFQNLIENALKYQQPGAEPEVHVSAAENGAACEFCVTDNGLGIAEEFRGKVFEMFKRLHHHREYRGTGIGLSLCQKIVERHGGRIWVEDRSDGRSGSVFKFTIPADTEKQHE